VKEGRTVYNNIEKAMLFLLPTNVAQALVIAVAIFFGLCCHRAPSGVECGVRSMPFIARISGSISGSKREKQGSYQLADPRQPFGESH
jgi:hypothetical protein